jgi:hypothetical protein
MLIPNIHIHTFGASMCESCDCDRLLQLYMAILGHEIFNYYLFADFEVTFALLCNGYCMERSQRFV